MKHQFNQSHRRGFTLVEMLVAVTIVLLIMLMLASVFEVATGTMTKQKGTAENDQQARTFTTILRSDLELRTFEKVVPFYPRSATARVDADLSVNDNYPRGYFYYAENDPASQQDDVLAFTVQADDGREFIGRATLLRDPDVGSDGIDDDLDGGDEADEANPENYLFFHPNQPEGDDGVNRGGGNPDTTYTDLTGVLNGVGMSKYAEVSYFLRGSNLHRRVMLIRNPYDPSNTTRYTPDYVSTNFPGSPNYAPLSSGEFWRDFDFSAYYHFRDDDAARNNDNTADPHYLGPRFNSRESLNNFPSSLQQLGELRVPLSLGAPFRRFGHDFLDGLIDDPPAITLAPLGRPREFVRPLNGGPQEDANGNGWLDPGEDANGNGRLDDLFMGRFLSQETAHANFDYPGSIPVTAEPAEPATPFNNAALTMNPVTYEINQFAANINRRGEDILMTNVTEFDVQILDDGLPTPRFVNLGHSEKTSMGVPIGHYNITRNQSWVDTNGNGTLDFVLDAATNKFRLTEPLLYGNRYDTWYAQEIQDLSGTSLPISMSHFQRPPYRPYSQGRGEVSPGNYTTYPGNLTPESNWVDADTNGTWDFFDNNGNGTYEAGTDVLAIDQLGFPGSDDVAYPAKAIQITVRFVDPATSLVRQVTFVESLD